MYHQVLVLQQMEVVQEHLNLMQLEVDLVEEENLEVEQVEQVVMMEEELQQQQILEQTEEQV